MNRVFLSARARAIGPARRSGGIMRGKWTRRTMAAAIALSLGFMLLVMTAAAPPKPTTDVLERQAQQTQDSFARAQRGSRESPTRGTSGLTFGPSTASGGAYIECLGTVSHASIDNNFARLMDEARKRCGTSTGP